jgi:hypothetical protein
LKSLPTLSPGGLQLSSQDLSSKPDGIDGICSELLKRASGTDEGQEPWRESGGLLWTCRDCPYEARHALGNYLSNWYLARAIATAAGVAIQWQCSSPVTDLIPQSWEPSSDVLDDRASFSWKDTCRREKMVLQYPHCSAERNGNDLGNSVSAIRFDLRNMTQSILLKTPWLADDLDEAVIHLRTGDIGRIEHSPYGLVPFNVYVDLIPKTAKTIGIVTAPYKQNRPMGTYGDEELNEAVTVALKEYIQRAFPDARITIRNDDVRETMAMTYARMVAANWLLCASSTFCLYPALATAGEAYILQSPLFGNELSWINGVAESFDNVHYVEREIVMTREFWSWNVADIVKRLQRQSISTY